MYKKYELRMRFTSISIKFEELFHVFIFIPQMWCFASLNHGAPHLFKQHLQLNDKKEDIADEIDQTPSFITRKFTFVICEI